MTVRDEELKPGQRRHGFIITRVTSLPHLRSRAIEAVHQDTGARFLHLANDDEENLFAISFRTPPPDDTGVAHILEHAVLCGSRKYPVKDPFVEMLKRSMATFLNAMTDSDLTVYPLASNVKQDFFNLADVYCDAVFHPRISPWTLKQEGHHLALARPDEPEQSSLLIKGIVYSEMKGAYSEVESYHQRIADKWLFPDSPYGRDSGGDPLEIPNLEYEQFRAFHRRFYHPSNARIFVYGNIAPTEHLSFLDQRLSECSPASDDQVDSSIPRQPRWFEPRRIQQPYPAESDAAPDSDSIVSLHWLVGDGSDPVQDLGMDLLSRLLLDHASAPLYKALIDSHLGKGLTSSGYQGGGFETTFQVGLRGTSAARTEEIENLILHTLERAAEDGFAAERVEEAFHQLQYSLREINSEYPLKLMFWAYTHWNYGLDPLTYYHTESILEKLASEINRDPGWLGSLLRERILDNPHRLTLTMVPDSELQEHRDEQSAARLAELKAAMNREELNRIQEEAEQLEKAQSKANNASELASLPQLPVSAIPDKPREIPGQRWELGENAVFLHNQIFSNRINYLQLGIDLSGLPRDLWPWLPLFCHLFSQLGTDKCDYETISRRIAGTTSRLQAADFVSTKVRNPEELITQFTINFMALDESLEKSLELVKELLFSLDFSNHQRLRDVIEQIREACLSSIVPNGHRLAALHAARFLSPVSNLAEICHGVPQVRRINRLAVDFPARVEEMVEKMKTVQAYLCSKNRLTLSFTGESGQARKAAEWVTELEREMSPPFTPAGQSVENWSPPMTGGAPEGLAFMADVAYCAVCLPAPGFNDNRSVPLKLLAHILNFDYVWENIRVRGGAYGAACKYDPAGSLVKLISHQDPDIVNTMKTSDGLIEYLESLSLDQDTLDRARIACAKGNQRPLRPGPAARAAFARYLCGMTPELNRQRRQRLLEVSAEEVRQAGIEVFRQGAKKERRCVVANRRRLEEANQKLSRPMEIENLLAEAW